MDEKFFVHVPTDLRTELRNGFSEKDLDLFWNTLANMFDHDLSVSQGEMAPQKLIAFKHQNELGTTRTRKLYRAKGYSVWYRPNTRV